MNKRAIKSVNLKKAEGIFIIINSFLPAIIVFFISLGAFITYKAAEQALHQYTQSIENIIVQAKVAKIEVQKATVDIANVAMQIKGEGGKLSKKINAMVNNVEETVSSMGNEFADGVEDLALKITIPVIKKDIDIKFGNVLKEPMRSIGTKVAEPFIPLTTSFSDISDSVSTIKSQMSRVTQALSGLQHMEQYLDKVVVEYQNILEAVDTIGAIFAKALMWLVWFMVVLALWFAFSYIFWVKRRLTLGFSLFSSTASA